MEDPETCRFSDLTVTFDKLGSFRGEDPRADRIKAMRDMVKKEIGKLQKLAGDAEDQKFTEEITATTGTVVYLFLAVQSFEKTYSAKKREKNVLDFSDLEHMALQLFLTEQEDGTFRRTETAKLVSERFDEIMTDEYQDTNDVQDYLFESISQNSANRFMVGDVKQSIYSFRQAMPDIFIRYKDKFPRYNREKDAYPASIVLDRNFRSRKTVTESVNFVFTQLMSRTCGGIDYVGDEKLAAGAQYPEKSGCETRVEFLEDIDGVGAEVLEPQRIAKIICELMESGFTVTENGQERPIEYRDFCILLRGRGDFAVYEAALRTAGIPVFADTAADLLDEPHIRPFAALLRVIDNPAQDIPLAAVLLSPMFPYTADDLVTLRGACPEGSLYGAVLYGGQPRFAPFLETLAEFRRLARTLPVDALLEELLARTGYLAAVGALPEGARCREDLQSFCAWAASAGRTGLPGVIRAMDAARQNGGLTQSTGGQTRPGCVSIMTVHRSKGLEFPVVFVANTSHQFNQSDAIRPVLTHSRLGVGVMLRAGSTAKRYKTLPYAALAQAIRTETLSEEMRVLYVALTRAQDALIITIPLKKAASSLKTPALCAHAEATGPEAMQGMSSWAGWLLTAVLLHPSSDALWAYTGLLPHYLPTRIPLTIKVLPAPEATPAPEPAPAPAPDEALLDTLRQSFAWCNPRAPLQKIPAKVSVSAVAHAARPVALERPAFLQKTGMTGAERGTAIHAFMQSVPFDGTTPDLDAEVQRQIDARLLDAGLADKLDLDRVRPFFESAVWRRIRHARAVLREEPFITALPAAQITPEAGECEAEVLVQGIADLVLVYDDHAEILDYKTDRSRDAAFYIKEYAAQLQLYRRAFAQRLAVPVTKLTIYSFTLGEEIDIPLQATQKNL